MIGLPNLTWFPKPFGAGDTDGTGAQRVLGQPDVDLQTLLVRETAQNSWDAALPGQVPHFEMRLRTLGDDVRDVLRWNILRGAAPNLGLDEALGASCLLATEISDRGTKGLGGPTRNDIEIPHGAIKDYADFVLTIGAPPDTDRGGGTYGFGKTASYMASSCSTIVIWSRFWDDRSDAYEERLIASAMGPSFTVDGQRYTGRQWWGVTAGEPSAAFMPEPITGVGARQLGEAVFSRGFANDETGTSLLILQPWLPEDEGSSDPESALLGRWTQALLENLWPKVPGTQAQDRTMSLAIYRNDDPIPLWTPTDSPLWGAKIRCLDAIRRRQAGESVADPLVRLETIESQRPKEILGHLALTHVVAPEDDPMRNSVDSVTYMRNRAELVVKTQPFGGSAAGGFRWVGVFKPVAAKDPAFAMSEPPAHDTWAPEGMNDRAAKRSVNVALREIRTRTMAFLTPTVIASGTDELASTGALAAALAGLTGSTTGGRAVPKGVKPRVSRSSASTKPKVEVLSVTPLVMNADDRSTGRQRTEVALALRGATHANVFPTALAIAVEGGALSGDDQVRLEHWVNRQGTDFRADHVTLAPNQTVGAVISYPAGIAIDFKFGVEEI